MFFQRCWTCSKAFPLFSHALNGSKKWAFGWQVEVPPKAVAPKAVAPPKAVAKRLPPLMRAESKAASMATVRKALVARAATSKAKAMAKAQPSA